ncbi:hypothetical protein GGX14DRAFT_400606 [Mycena pura]|uniref:Uncharacterized protein n=1 Tax=Mycena pura TaxID=153505 RepID=A0AAD6Y5Q0_9AGAR|nr:hypothetical protein GGX14DRAFT_400606 [Mycena pura]
MPREANRSQVTAAEVTVEMVQYWPPEVNVLGVRVTSRNTPDARRQTAKSTSTFRPTVSRVQIRELAAYVHGTPAALATTCRGLDATNCANYTGVTNVTDESIAPITGKFPAVLCSKTTVYTILADVICVLAASWKAGRHWMGTCHELQQTLSAVAALSGRCGAAAHLVWQARTTATRSTARARALYVLTLTCFSSGAQNTSPTARTTPTRSTYPYDVPSNSGGFSSGGTGHQERSLRVCAGASAAWGVESESMRRAVPGGGGAGRQKRAERTQGRQRRGDELRDVHGGGALQCKGHEEPELLRRESQLCGELDDRIELCLREVRRRRGNGSAEVRREALLLGPAATAAARARTWRWHRRQTH